MLTEIPAEGIMKTNDWGNSKVYRVACSCSSEDHDHNVWVEAEDVGITVTIYSTTKTNWWSKTRWYHIWTLLTKGYIDTESTIHLTEQQSLNYAETLKSAILDVKEFRKIRNEQNKNRRTIL
jgi:hypothetical protein